MAIKVDDKSFTIQTKNTSYVFTIKNGVPVHLYYGEKIDLGSDLNYIVPDRTRSFAPYHVEHGNQFTLDNVKLECSVYGSGDFRTPSIKLENSNGTCHYSFAYNGYSIIKGRVELPNMPCARADDLVETLIVSLVSDLAEIKLYYTIYYDIDVISTYTSIKNLGPESMTISKIVSATQDFFGEGYKILTLQGRPAFERTRHVQSVPYGKYQLTSDKGASSSYSSPFAIIAQDNVNESTGDCYGFNLVYSGNFKLETEYNDHKKLRFAMGINDDNFSYSLRSGDEFFTPEVARAFSNNGYNGVSINFSDYIKNYVMPEKFALSARPVVINTWEAFYFDINEDKMLKFADIAKKCGIDTLVIDDGWFSSRRNDDSGLGDWSVSSEIFPSGLKSFVKRINEKGLNVGIWIEPEMVNPDSVLYRTHPEWVLGDANIQSRNQLVLDFTNPNVVEYIYNSLTQTLADSGVSFVKWDMNRFIMPFVSDYTKNSSQVAHAYMLGVYKLIENLTSSMPNVLFETCSGGGGRFDAGMMHYSPQIWTSDNTCPFERAYIQAGASYAYPISSMSCHVTQTPNAGTQLITSPEFRFGMALNGVLGYEFNLFNLSDEDCKRIKGEIEFYRSVQDLILKGDFYRLITPFDNPKYYSYIIVSKDKKKALFSFNALMNFCNSEDVVIKIYGLRDDFFYRVDGKVVSGKVLRCVGIPMPKITKSGSNYTIIIEKE